MTRFHLGKAFLSHLSFVIILLVVSNLSAQMTVERLFDTVYQNFQKSIHNIDDYTVINELGANYYKKSADDKGRHYFKSSVEIEEHGIISTENESSLNDIMYNPVVLDKLKNVAIYEGIRTADGFRSHVIRVHDLTDVIPDYTEDYDVIKTIRLFYDTEDLLLRRMEVEAEVEVEEGVVREINQVIKLQDYRNVNGMKIAYETVYIIEGIADTMSAEEREEALKGLEEMERRLAEMSEEDREMMLRMLGPQLDEYRKMIETGRLEFSSVIEEVVVNTGLSDDLFD